LNKWLCPFQSDPLHCRHVTCRCILTRTPFFILVFFYCFTMSICVDISIKKRAFIAIILFRDFLWINNLLFTNTLYDTNVAKYTNYGIWHNYSIRNNIHTIFYDVAGYIKSFSTRLDLQEHDTSNLLLHLFKRFSK